MTLVTLTLDNTIGAAYLGVVGSAILFGVSNLQTYIYYTQYPHDWRWQKFSFRVPRQAGTSRSIVSNSPSATRATIKLIKPIATGLVKKQIQKAIADAIRTGFEYVDEQLVVVRDRMSEAKATDELSCTQVLQELFKRKQDEAAGKKNEAQAKAAERNSQFKIVATKDNSVLPNVGHPDGLVNKTTAREHAAGQGHEWRSDAFTIV
ncbi:hypothetical protein HGRIS_006566 [Hohenbuehelia grisea]|uniref:HAM1-like C-terminal domain-containing protein n=1 Tax=Hohenbuehelia grisea TaxID=104357 RepID=A0ABR3J9B3_9AGAR